MKIPKNLIQLPNPTDQEGNNQKSSSKKNHQEQHNKSQEKIAKALDAEVKQESLNEDGKRLYQEIKEEIISRLKSELKEGELKQATDKTYNLYQYYRVHPDKAPPMQIAGPLAAVIGVVVSDVSLGVGMSLSDFLIGSAVGSVLAYIGDKSEQLLEYGKEKAISLLANSILDPDEAESYNDTISRKDYLNKQKEKNKQNKLASQSILATPNPDDFDQDDEQSGKEKNEEYKNTERKLNCEKSESPIWKELQNYRNGIKTNNKKETRIRFYE